MPGVLDDQLRARVVPAPVGRLATVAAGGRPHAVPCCFALDGDVIYSAVDDKPKRSRRLARLAHIAAHPRVCLLVDHYEDDWARLWWVRLDGRARVVEAGPERDRGLGLLAQKYPQYRERPPTGPVIAVTVERAVSWSAS